MVLDASKGEEQKRKLTRELDMVGIRLNRSAPDVTFVPTKGGGLRFNSTVRSTHVRDY
jgi:ribosome-interacting GTPase 1